MNKISIIIPAYNEKERIKFCLESIVKSNFPRNFIELIVVDNNSTDKTAHVAEQYTDIIVQHKIQDPYSARNAGVKYSSSNLLIFIDADTIISPNLLIDTSLAIGKGFVGGACRKIPDINSAFHNLIWMSYDYVDIIWSLLLKRPYNFFAAYCFVDRQVYELVGGFDPLKGVNADHSFARQIAQFGPVAYIRKSYIIFSLRRLKHVGYLKYWLRTKLNNHKHYPHYN